MRKNAIVTINIGEYFKDMAALTIPNMKAYAEKVDAEFVEINDAKLLGKVDDFAAYWAKFQLHDCLNDYERIVYLDLDTVIFPHCPDLFEMVPETQIAALFESDFIKKPFADVLPGPNGKLEYFKDKYFNVGVMVISRCHQPVFELIAGEKGGRKYPEQTLINAKVKRLGFEIFPLDYRFNHMYFIGPYDNTRGESNIVHYAGLPLEIRLALIADDISRYKQGKPLFDLSGNGFEQFLQLHLGDIRAEELSYKLINNKEGGLI